MLKAKTIKLCYTLFVLFLMFALAIMSDGVMESVRQSLAICFSSVIPSVFPFMVLSSLFTSAVSDFSFGRIGKTVTRIFGISPCAISAMICGILCGYPIGARCIVELYKDKKITVSEAECLMGYCNNAGPLFVIGAVGCGMLKSVQLGIILYIIEIISVFSVSIILRKRIYTRHLPALPVKKTSSVSQAICGSVTGIMNVCGFVIFFGAINGMLKPLLDILPQYISCGVSAFTEISNASSYISTNVRDMGIKIILISSALGWSGMSVHLQIKSIVSSTDISLRTYYISRLFMSVLSGFIAYAVIFMRDGIFLKLLTHRWIIPFFTVFAVMVLFKETERKPPYRKSPLCKKSY